MIICYARSVHEWCPQYLVSLTLKWSIIGKSCAWIELFVFLIVVPSSPSSRHIWTRTTRNRIIPFLHTCHLSAGPHGNRCLPIVSARIRFTPKIKHIWVFIFVSFVLTFAFTANRIYANISGVQIHKNTIKICYFSTIATVVIKCPVSQVIYSFWMSFTTTTVSSGLSIFYYLLFAIWWHVIITIFPSSSSLYLHWFSATVSAAL